MSDETVVVVTEGDDTETPDAEEIAETIADTVEDVQHDNVERELSERVKELEVRSERYVDREELGWLDDRISEAIRIAYETRSDVVDIVEEVQSEPEPEPEVEVEVISPEDDSPPKRKHWFFGER